MTEYVEAALAGKGHVEGEDGFRELAERNPGWRFKVGQVYVAENSALVIGAGELDAGEHVLAQNVFNGVEG